MSQIDGQSFRLLARWAGVKAGEVEENAMPGKLSNGRNSYGASRGRIVNSDNIPLRQKKGNM